MPERPTTMHMPAPHVKRGRPSAFVYAGYCKILEREPPIALFGSCSEPMQTLECRLFRPMRCKEAAQDRVGG